MNEIPFHPPSSHGDTLARWQAMAEGSCADCTDGCLASTNGCAIYRRPDGSLDLQIEETSHHMNALQFDALARLCKLALGMDMHNKPPSPIKTVEEMGFPPQIKTTL